MIGRAIDRSTLPQLAGSEASSGATDVELLGLSVLWSRDAPERVGELLLLPPSHDGPWIFGRGGGGDDEGRLSLVRHLPGVVVATGPLASPRISRSQLQLSASPAGTLLVENLGSCPLVRGGAEVRIAELVPGDVIALKNELLFLCVRRRPIPPPLSQDLALPAHPFGAPDSFGLVGESPAIWALRHRIAAVAREAVHVIVLGDSGAGKELVAQALHARSARASRPLVARNAATIPEGLADAELFGNVRNYPNPGMPERAGLVGEAHGTTLFLDELAELPPSIQAHLLRVMDHGEYQRLGEATTRRADLRIVAATNRPVTHIKHDVLARLEVRLHVPGLDDRREDIPMLVAHLMRRHAMAEKGASRRFFPNDDLTATPRVSPVLIEALVGHAYTTHVRELDALLVKAMLASRDRYVELTAEVRRDLERSAPPPKTGSPIGASAKLTREERERLALLREHRWSPTACGRDPRYPGNRQTADFHLRQLFCRALELAGSDVGAAVDLLAGDDVALRERCEARLSTFLGNLRARIASETAADLERALTEEWKGTARMVLFVVEAVRDGRIAS